LFQTYGFFCEVDVDGDVIGVKHEKFMKNRREGTLLSPDTVGKVVAGMAVCKNEGLKKFNGMFVNWNDSTIATVL
jgi:hypothetical protein